MKKYAIYLVVLLMAGVGTACSSGGSEGGPDYSSPDYGKFVITHSRKSFEKIPVFTPANDITGTITWSDGKTEEWKRSAIHVYEGAGPYKATYDLWKAKMVEISGIGKLREVDFSQF